MPVDKQTDKFVETLEPRVRACCIAHIGFGTSLLIFGTSLVIGTDYGSDGYGMLLSAWFPVAGIVGYKSTFNNDWIFSQELLVRIFLFFCLGGLGISFFVIGIMTYVIGYHILGMEDNALYFLGGLFVALLGFLEAFVCCLSIMHCCRALCGWFEPDQPTAVKAASRKSSSPAYAPPTAQNEEPSILPRVTGSLGRLPKDPHGSSGRIEINTEESYALFVAETPPEERKTPISREMSTSTPKPPVTPRTKRLQSTTSSKLILAPMRQAANNPVSPTAKSTGEMTPGPPVSSLYGQSSSPFIHTVHKTSPSHTWQPPLPIRADSPPWHNDINHSVEMPPWQKSPGNVRRQWSDGVNKNESQQSNWQLEEMMDSEVPKWREQTHPTHWQTQPIPHTGTPTWRNADEYKRNQHSRWHENGPYLNQTPNWESSPPVASGPPTKPGSPETNI